MNIVWTQNAMADLTQLVENNQRKILLKIIKLINDIQRNGAEKGLGKPEALKHDLSGYWSREITDEDRLVIISQKMNHQYSSEHHQYQ